MNNEANKVRIILLIMSLLLFGFGCDGLVQINVKGYDIELEEVKNLIDNFFGMCVLDPIGHQICVFYCEEKLEQEPLEHLVFCISICDSRYLCSTAFEMED